MKLNSSLLIVHSVSSSVNSAPFSHWVGKLPRLETWRPPFLFHFCHATFVETAFEHLFDILEARCQLWNRVMDTWGWCVLNDSYYRRSWSVPGTLKNSIIVPNSTLQWAYGVLNQNSSQWLLVAWEDERTLAGQVVRLLETLLTSPGPDRLELEKVRNSAKITQYVSGRGRTRVMFYVSAKDNTSNL